MLLYSVESLLFCREGQGSGRLAAVNGPKVSMNGSFQAPMMSVTPRGSRGVCLMAAEKNRAIVGYEVL